MPPSVAGAKVATTERAPAPSPDGSYDRVATPVGEERFHHYAEFEFPDMASFQEVARSPEFAATGEDAATMGIPFSAQVVVIEE